MPSSRSDAESTTATHFSTPMADADQPDLPDQDDSDDPIADAVNNDEDDISLTDHADENAQKDTLDDGAPTRQRDDVSASARDAQPLNNSLRNDAPHDVAPKPDRIEDQLAQVLNDIRATLQKKHGCDVSVTGAVNISLAKENAQTYRLQLFDDRNHTPARVGIQVKHTTNEEIAATERPTKLQIPQRASAADGASGGSTTDTLLSRKRRKMSGNEPNTRTQGSNSINARDVDMSREKSLNDLTLGDLERLLGETRDDVQEDTIDALAHTHRLLSKFHEQWQANNAWMQEHTSSAVARVPSLRRDASAPNGKSLTVPHHSPEAPSAAFPQSAGGISSDASGASPSSMRHEFLQISKQIRWVEECRRLAHDIHDKREEQWRVSSATFHDSSRRDREKFEKWMYAEMPRQGGLLTNIFNEIKGLSNLMYALKWELPGVGAGGAPPTATGARGPPAYSPVGFTPPPFPSSAPPVGRSASYPASFQGMNPVVVKEKPVPIPRQRVGPVQHVFLNSTGKPGQKRAAPS